VRGVLGHGAGCAAFSYTQDGYGTSTVANTGGGYSECADPSAPGVAAINAYLAALPYKTFNKCQPGRFYLLNNYNAGYNLNGSLNTAPYTVPPQKSDYVTIGNELSHRGISWAYYGQGYNNGNVQSQYCGICDPMQYSASIMTNPALRKNVQHGLSDFVAAQLQRGQPAERHPRGLRAARPARDRQPDDKLHLRPFRPLTRTVA
jgi:phospholipase C